jgi:hypothetical protein
LEKLNWLNKGLNWKENKVWKSIWPKLKELISLGDVIEYWVGLLNANKGLIGEVPILKNQLG